MNWFKSLVAGRSKEQVQAQAVPVGGIVPGTDMHAILSGGVVGGAGLNVTENSAMGVPAVYAGINLIGGAVASMPFHIYKRKAEGRDRADSELWWLFNESPWQGWTASSAWQLIIKSTILRGDAFWQIHRASPYTNTIIGFEPLLPWQVDKFVRQRVTDPYPVIDRYSGAVRYVDPVDMLHFPGAGFDGLRSMSAIQYALKSAAGIATAANEHAASFFNNGARPDFAIVVPGSPPREKILEIQERWEGRHQGVASSHRPAVLTGGMDIKEITMSAEDAQLLSTRQNQVEEVARTLGIPPAMLGYTEKSTSFGTGVEQQSIWFTRYTMGRHLDSISQEINMKVWPRSRMFYGEFNRESLLEGDSKSQANYFKAALGGPGAQGWMSVNEVRKLKNMPPQEGCDKVIMASQAKDAKENEAPKDDEINDKEET